MLAGQMTVFGMLLGSALLVAGPVVGPEVDVGAPERVPRSGDHGLVLSDGTNHLVVFDTRRDPTQYPKAAHLAAARVTGDGRLLDPLGIRIHARDAELFGGAFGAGYYLIAVESYEHGLEVVRVTQDGVVVDTQPIVVLGHGGLEQPDLAPIVTFDGTNFLVIASQRSVSAPWVVAWRIAPSGQVLDANPIVIQPEPNPPGVGGGMVTAAFDGTNHLVLWGLRGIHVRPDGTLVEAQPITFVPDPVGWLQEQTGPNLACDGSGGCFVTWETWEGYRWMAVRGARIPADGTLPDGPSGFVISQLYFGLPIDRRMSPTAHWDGERYNVIWTAHRDHGSELLGAGIGPAAIEVPEHSLFVCSTFDCFEPSFQTTPAGSVLTWKDDGLQAMLVDRNLTPLPESKFNVVWGHEDEAGGSSASNGAGHVVAWNRGGSVLLARTDVDGKLLDDPPLVLSSRGADIALATVGDEALAVWTDRTQDWSGDVLAMRVPASGAPGPVFPIAARHGSDVTNYEISPFVAASGDGYLVAWREGGSDSLRVRVARVAHDGTVKDPDGILLPGEGSSHWSAPRVASDGRNFLVAYGTSTARGRVDAVSVAWADGAVGTVQKVYDSNIDTRVDGLAFSGGQYLALFGEYRVRGARLDGEGRLLAPVFELHERSRDGDVLPRPSGFYVAWRDRRAGETQHALRGTAIAPDGTLASVDGDLLAGDISPRSTVRFGVGPSAKAFLFYDREEDGLPSPASRVRRRTLTFETSSQPPPGEPPPGGQPSGENPRGNGTPDPVAGGPVGETGTGCSFASSPPPRSLWPVGLLLACIALARRRAR
ncbi:hypothetical protein LVJ94_19935 [Pendulispora rubella]|uniref:MYXO-CTERM domain-containing protein n=1 Tax=Pendulispora rubella TaxID=2741070 RepID=A0ABZ2LEX2_9BACT